ncbi:hypothetical protein [Mucilaginibacter lappiensis]|uniref:Uncharacterized protein n=1 Tax=Mucilaginibacter lappiensis TaxID=354630 RepID=A0A1N7E7X1_9SPHI|nr:hypothetical protein [Mucilaginibacter lappiensis]MBB6111638.1 hypothetical protein [Mucilaginibacter lappiensis]MBB6131044.1 hypothetical protein [Mucilaginibacter lappiensis]SIR84126.1 hypothetical protein SAMN05421821_11383 [Mucilaginibacter lappiensis]
MKKKDKKSAPAEHDLKSSAIEQLKLKGIELEGGDTISGGFIETMDSGLPGFIEVHVDKKTNG